MIFSTKLTKPITFILIPYLLTSCSTLGSKTLYNGFKKENEISITRVTLTPPIKNNVDFYKESLDKFYFDEMEGIFKGYEIETTRSEFSIDFDDIKIESAGFLVTDIIICCKITRLTALGKTRDYLVEYKLYDPKESKLLYHSKYSTTFGQTYVVFPGSGLPSEEQLIRDAIKNGLTKIRKDILEK